MTKKLRAAALAVLLCALAGCFDVKDEVWWNPDGSAKLTRTVRLAATAADVTSRSDAISEALTVARIEVLRDARVKSFEVKTSIEGTTVVAVEELEVKDAKDLTAVALAAAKLANVEHLPAAVWCPGFAFEKLAHGNTQFHAVLGSLLPSSTPDSQRDRTAAALAGHSYTLVVHGPQIVTAGPRNPTLTGSTVEWKIPLGDLTAELPHDAELLAEIGQPVSAAVGVLAAIALVLVVAIVLVLRQQRLREKKLLRPPAPRTMPTVLDTGPIPVVASAEALISDASEINVDTEEEIPSAPLVAAQAAAAGVVKFKCPGCKVELKVPLHLAGRQGKCRKCGGTFVSPVPGQLKQVRAAAASKPAVEPATLREAFSVKKVKCSCGMTSAILKGRADGGEERCPACNQVLVLS